MARQLAFTVYVDGVAYGPDSDVPAEVAKRIDNPGAWASEGDGSEGDMTKAELQAEIDARNEARDDADKISRNGNKAELQAALAADDA